MNINLFGLPWKYFKRGFYNKEGKRNPALDYLHKLISSRGSQAILRAKRAERLAQLKADSIVAQAKAETKKVVFF